MERGWDRAHRFVDLSAGEMDRLVRAALPGARVVASQPLTAGLRNTNYRLELASGAPVVLRLYVADPEACAREAAILAAIAGRVPAPRVLYWDAEADPPFAVFEWLDGRPLDEILAEADAATANELAAACGAELARIHEIHFPAAGFLGPEMGVIRPMPAWAPTVLTTLAGRVEERLGPGPAAQVRETVEANAGSVEPVWSEAVLVHADYKPWNLLVRRVAGRPTAAGGVASGADRWQVVGILDWEFACAGCKLIDFATFVRDEAQRPAGFVDAFEAAYLAAGGTLPSDWRRLTRLVDLLNLVQLLVWADDRAAVELRRLVAETVARV